MSETKVHIQPRSKRYADEIVEEARVKFSKFTLDTLPHFLAWSMYRVSEFKGMEGDLKKEVVIAVLQELCPSDTVDAMIPSLIEVYLMLDKHQMRVVASTGKKLFGLSC